MGLLSLLLMLPSLVKVEVLGVDVGVLGAETWKGLGVMFEKEGGDGVGEGVNDEASVMSIKGPFRRTGEEGRAKMGAEEEGVLVRVMEGSVS